MIHSRVLRQRLMKMTKESQRSLWSESMQNSLLELQMQTAECEAVVSLIHADTRWVDSRWYNNLDEWIGAEDTQVCPLIRKYAELSGITTPAALAGELRMELNKKYTSWMDLISYQFGKQGKKTNPLPTIVRMVKEMKPIQSPQQIVEGSSNSLLEVIQEEGPSSPDPQMAQETEQIKV